MCGIIGILGKSPVTELLYYAMLQLQHRGQDASGLFLADPNLKEPYLRKKSGWVSNLFSSEEPLPDARLALGHIRYSTSGKGGLGDAQPLVLKKNDTTFAIAHNGNLVNYLPLKEILEKEGAQFRTTCDSETILHLISQKMKSLSFASLYSAIDSLYDHLIGAYSVIGLITDFGLFALRDPNGIRPLLLGRGKEIAAVASETQALANIGCDQIEDVRPGELIFLDLNGHLHRTLLRSEKHAHCAFEFNYFAKTHTIMEGKEVYTVRSHLGKSLAEKIRASDIGPIDVIIPIPETGVPSAIALSQHLQIPFAEGFIRQQTSGRTFIVAGQEKRAMAAFQKLAPNRSAFKNKSVLLVDDSIVRGTVSKRTVNLARSAGAKKVYFASTFPPILHPCVYGIDFPSQNQLIAWNRPLPDISSEINADAVIYNDIESLKKAIGLPDLCLACMTGRYPTSTKDMRSLQILRESHLLHK